MRLPWLAAGRHGTARRDGCPTPWEPAGVAVCGARLWPRFLPQLGMPHGTDTGRAPQWGCAGFPQAQGVPTLPTDMARWVKSGMCPPREAPGGCGRTQPLSTGSPQPLPCVPPTHAHSQGEGFHAPGLHVGSYLCARGWHGGQVAVPRVGCGAGPPQHPLGSGLGSAACSWRRAAGACLLLREPCQARGGTCLRRGLAKVRRRPGASRRWPTHNVTVPRGLAGSWRDVPGGCRAPWRGTANAWHGRDSPWGPVCAHAGVSPPAACGAPGRQGSQPRSPAGRILLPRRWHRGHRQALSQPSPAHRMPDPEILGSGRARQSPRCHAGTAPFISQGWRKEGDPGAPRTKAVLWPHAGERGVGKIQQEGTREEKAAPRAQQGSMDALAVAPAHPQHLVRARDAAGRALLGPRGPRARRCGFSCRFGAGWMCGPAAVHAAGEAQRKGRALLSQALTAQGGDRALSLATVVRRELEGDELIKSH